MILKSKSYRNEMLISIIVVIVITSGVGFAYADGTFPGKNIFGETTGTHVNIASGTNSVAFGYNTTASGYQSTAFGAYTTATLYGSTAFGYTTNASGWYSTAFGITTSAQSFASFVIGRCNEVSGTTGSWVLTDPIFVIGNGAWSGDCTSSHNAMTVLKNGNVGIGNSNPFNALVVEGTAIFGKTTGNSANVASGTNSAAFGLGTTASAYYSTAFGSYNSASGHSSAAFGSYTTASGSYSTTFGYTTTASGYASAAFGTGTTASGGYSTAFGYYTTAQPLASFVIGRCNEVSGTTNSWTATDPLFVIGNGDWSAGCSSYVNAVTVLKNGNIGIGISSPTTLLHVSGETAQMPLALLQASEGNGLYIHGWKNGANIDPSIAGDNIYIGRDVKLGNLFIQTGNVGIGKTSANSALDVSGYIELDRSSGVPPKADCDKTNEVGRMKVDESSTALYLCTSYGWTFIKGSPLY